MPKDPTERLLDLLADAYEPNDPKSFDLDREDLDL